MVTPTVTSAPETGFGGALTCDARDGMYAPEIRGLVAADGDQLRAAGSRRGMFAAPVRARDIRALWADVDADELRTQSGVVGLWYGSFRQAAADDLLAALAESCAT